MSPVTGGPEANRSPKFDTLSGHEFTGQRRRRNISSKQVTQSNNNAMRPQKPTSGYFNNA